MNKQQLKKRIALTELKLKQLSQHRSASELCESLFNSLILEKAIMKKELEELEKNKVIEKFKKLIPHKEKLICDYFS